VRERGDDRTGSRADSGYTRTWSPSGEVEYATLGDGTRLRYLKTGSGHSPLILLHTVRTQLDHFQLVIPKLLPTFTVYAIDLPGMGWSDITPDASYTEPALRSAIVELVNMLDLEDVTLAGESMGATVSLTASTQLERRVRRVVAFNAYDYSGGVGRANAVAAAYIGAARLPVGGWSRGWRTGRSSVWCCVAAYTNTGSCRLTTSQSCAASAAVAAMRASRVRCIATSRA
jgi:pimeloyl-ACP methyl ester carboxylesterase